MPEEQPEQEPRGEDEAERRSRQQRRERRERRREQREQRRRQQEAQLYERMTLLAKRLLGRRLQKADADDLIQNLMLEFLKKRRTSLPRLDFDREVAPLVGKAVRYKQLDHVRNRKRWDASLTDYETARADAEQTPRTPEAELELKEMTAIIGRTLARMSSQRRETFLRVRADELTYEQVAKERGIGMSAVNMHMVRAGHDLRAALIDYVG